MSAPRLEPGLGYVECADCERCVLCLVGAPLKPWRWTARGWVCGDHEETDRV